MTDDIVLVCGLGRCGSSMVMQMLHAGGFPVTGTAPSFEDGRALACLPTAQAREYRGKAVKLLQAHSLSRLGARSRAIWLERDPVEQAKSMAAFLQAVEGVAMSRHGLRGYRKLMDRDRRNGLRFLTANISRPLLALTFEEILRAPGDAALTIASWIGLPLDVAAMQRAILPRSATCLGLPLDVLTLGGAA